MAAFATSDDLATRWRPLSVGEEARAESLLDDAALWLRSWFPDLDARLLDGSLDEGIPLMVSCAMVKRAMLNTEYDGLASVANTQTAGVYSDAVNRTFSNPSGNLYITSAERDLMLGVSGHTAVSRMSPGL